MKANERYKKYRLIKISMARRKKTDLISLSLFVLGGLILSQNNPLGWILVVLGIYRMLEL